MVGDLKAALEDCNAALRLKPNNASALDHRGMAYLKLGQPDQALIDYDEALKLNPNSPAALYGRGVAKLMKGDVFAEQRRLRGGEGASSRASPKSSPRSACAPQPIQLYWR